MIRWNSSKAITKTELQTPEDKVEAEEMEIEKKKLLDAQGKCHREVRGRRQCEKEFGKGHDICNGSSFGEKVCLAHMLCPEVAAEYVTACGKNWEAYQQRYKKDAQDPASIEQRKECKKATYALVGCMTKYFKNVEKRE